MPYCHAKSFRGNALGDFHAAIWEMYLACVMLNHDLPLAKPPAVGAPDIRLAVTPRTVWVEANAPDRGAGDNRVERKIRQTGDGGKWALYTPDRDGMMLRYTNAIHEKQKKIDRYLEDGTVSGDEPVVVAINGGLLPDASQGDFEIPDIAKCLYGLGEEYVSIPVGGGGEPKQGIHPRPSITNARGAEVSLRGFIDGDYSRVAGVLYAPYAIWNAVPPWKSSAPGDEFIFVHNASAETPAPHGVFPFGREWVPQDGQLVAIDHRGSSSPRRQGVAASSPGPQV